MSCLHFGNETWAQEKLMEATSTGASLGHVSFPTGLKGRVLAPMLQGYQLVVHERNFDIKWIKTLIWMWPVGAGVKEEKDKRRWMNEAEAVWRGRGEGEEDGWREEKKAISHKRSHHERGAAHSLGKTNSLLWVCVHVYCLCVCVLSVCAVKGRIFPALIKSLWPGVMWWENTMAIWGSNPSGLTSKHIGPSTYTVALSLHCLPLCPSVYPVPLNHAQSTPVSPSLLLATWTWETHENSHEKH